MANPPSSLPAALPGQTLVTQVREAIRAQVLKGRYKPGDRLPSEARLTQEFGVSRTVIREAVAALRSDKLVEPRQGAGVFVLPPPEEEAPFRNLDPARLSSLIEMLELRAAVEGDAAGFAALRRSPAQEEKIVEAFHELSALSEAGRPTVDADLRFHLSVAEGANNPRFPEFLRLIGPTLIPRRAAEGEEAPVSRDEAAILRAEHEAILAGIQNGDEDEARAAMRLHLKNSQLRHRDHLRRPRG